MNRRVFIKSGFAAVGAAALCNDARAEAPHSKPCGVGGYDYRLPDFKNGSRLLFQGDSITDMKWGRNQADRNHYLGHSYVYLIAARLGVEMPEMQLDVYNRGVSGNTVADLRKRWQQDGIDMKPDLLSILIGTNDVARSVQPDAFEADYRYILDDSRKANPDLRLVLLDPFVLHCGRFKEDAAWTARRSAIDTFGIVVAKLAKEYGAVHVATQAIFDNAAAAISPEHWIWDDVHPLPQGHELIARYWLQDVSARWHL